MEGKPVKLRGELIESLDEIPGDSYSDKVKHLLKHQTKPNDSKEVDYDKIKGIVDKSVQDALVELQHGRL